MKYLVKSITVNADIPENTVAQQHLEGSHYDEYISLSIWDCAGVEIDGITISADDARTHDEIWDIINAHRPPKDGRTASLYCRMHKEEYSVELDIVQ